MDIETLPDDVPTLKAIIVKQHEVIEQLRQQVEHLQAQVEKLQKLLFGQKTERRPKAAATVQPEKNLSIKNPNLLKGQSNGRRKLPEHLERIRIEHDVPTELQVCTNCQNALHRMGEVVSEQLDFMPAKLYVKQHVRYKYACRCCQLMVVTANMPEQPIAKGLAGSSLLAALFV